VQLKFIVLLYNDVKEVRSLLGYTVGQTLFLMRGRKLVKHSSCLYLTI